MTCYGDDGGPTSVTTDDEAAAYGRYAGAPSRADLERVFFVDDEDRALVERHRGEHMKLGFSLHLVTVRWVGMFLEDPLDVPTAVLDFMAEQLGVADPSCPSSPPSASRPHGPHRARRPADTTAAPVRHPTSSMHSGEEPE
ncbi:putative Transposase TnpA [Frankia alni ACN14a]|uniref:Transposase TnpA n=1 Tax=Frankia alni (strain DSM 45986 / CECT 9034 / ACN14a) TaxID=326424 RepID=Q0RJJ3_FRAAA|nr:putative Transposase TnpA [Frankia alni ACN14a]